MLSEILTFVIFLLIGLEIREGLNKPKDAILPALCALSGMVLPALIFYSINPDSQAWAVTMPTDVALAIGALSFLGKKVNPAIRIFLLTLAVADDLFSLVAIGIFFRNDLHLASAIYTLGAALVGFLLPVREKLIKLLTPLSTFIVIPLYIWINLLSKLDLSHTFAKISVSIVVSTGMLAGMGLTVSLVIAEITLPRAEEISQVRSGLFVAALLSGLLGVAWLKVFGTHKGTRK